MKRILRKLLEAVYFMLCFMPAPLMIGFALLGEEAGFAPLIMSACVVPVAYIVSLLPGYVGGRKKPETVAEARVSRSGDPDPDRNLRRDTHEDEEKSRAFPLRAAVCFTLFFAIAIYLFFGPVWRLTGDWLTRVILALTPAVMMPAALIFCASGRSADSRNVIAGVVLYAVAGIAAIAIRSHALDACLGAGGGAFMIASLWMINDGAMHTGAASRTGVKPPAAMRRHNRALLIGLMLICALIAGFNWLREKAEWLLGVVSSAIGRAFMALARFFAGSEQAGGMGGGGADEMDLSGLAEAQEPSKFWEIMTYVAYVLAAIIVLVLLYFMVRKLARMAKALAARIGAWMGRVTRAAGEDYKDEQESLLDWGDVKKDMSESFKKRWEALFKREKKWTLMDAREKARYLVRTLYKRGHIPADGRTLREIMPELNAPDPDALAAAYETARYADRDPDEALLERLRRDERA